MAEPEHISQALADELATYPPGMLAALGGGAGGNLPRPDQPMLFEVADDRPERFIGPPSRLAARPSRRDAQRP